nr:hypothetical protein GCM10020063_018930 [Dactylosporangium thailandense]
MTPTGPEWSIARVLGKNGPVGLAFPVDDVHLVTCAHVINAVLNRPAREPGKPDSADVVVTFPFADEDGAPAQRIAKVVGWLPGNGTFDLFDLALIEVVGGLPAGAAPLPLAAASTAGPVRMWGPTPGRANEGHVGGQIMGSTDRSRLQVDQPTAGTFRVGRGFSGGPAWDPGTGQVVGVVQAAGAEDTANDVYMISADVVRGLVERCLDRPVAAGPAAAAPYMVRPRSGHVVERIELLNSVIDLLEQQGPGTVGLTTALQGAGGFGKTTTAEEVCRSPAAQRMFPGGILWITIGESATGVELSAKINDLSEALSGVRPALTDPEQAGFRLGQLLADERRLLVIDDVWQATQLTPFMFGGPNCSRLVTTRIHAVLPDNARTIVVDAMRNAEAREMLQAGVGSIPHLLLDDLLAVTGQWPVLMGLVNATIRSLIRGGRSPAEAADVTARRIRDRGPTSLDLTNPRRRAEAVAATLEVSLSGLSSEYLDRYLELAVFPEDVDITRATLVSFWKATGGLADFDVDLVSARLVDLSLALPGREDRSALRLHDVIRTYLRQRAGARLTQMNRLLLEGAWSEIPADPVSGETGWWLIPAANRYLWDQLIYHMREAALPQLAVSVLCDLRYVMAKLEHRGPVALESDLTDSGDRTVETMRLCVSRNTHLLVDVEPRSALVSTLLSRMAVYSDLRSFVAAYQEDRVEPLTLPSWPLPDEPHPALARTIQIQADVVSRCFADPSLAWFGVLASDSVVRLFDMSTGQLIHALVGHDAAVLDVAASFDGALLVTASADGTAKLWSTRTGEALWTATQNGVVPCCAIAPNGRWCVTGTDDGDVIVRDAGTGMPMQQLSASFRRITSVAIAPDMSWIVTAADSRARIWDVATGECLATLTDHEDEVYLAVVSSDGRWLATACADGRVRLWDAETWELRHVFNVFPATSRFSATVGRRGATLAIANDCSWLLTGSSEGTVSMWDLTGGTGKEIATHHVSTINTCAISPDDTWFLTADANGLIQITDVETGHAEELLRGHRAAVSSCVITADGGSVISVGEDRSARVWKVKSSRSHVVLAGHTRGVLSCGFSPSGATLVSSDSMGTVAVWDLGTMRRTRTLTNAGERASCCRVSPSGALVVAAFDSGAVRVWSADTAEPVLQLNVKHHGAVTCAVSADDALLAIGCADGVTLVYTLPGGRLRHTLKGHDATVNDCAFSPDADLLVTASSDGTARIWNVERGKRMHVLSHHQGWVSSCAISATGRWLFTAGADHKVRCYDLKTGEYQRTYTGPIGRINSCDVSVDMRLCAVGDDGTMVVWNARTGVIMRALEAHSVAAYACRFSPDGLQVATASQDHTVRIWDVSNVGAGEHSLGHVGGIRDCASGPDGAWLVTAGSDRTLRMWNTETAEQLVNRESGPSALHSCAVSADGSVVLSGGEDRKGRLWQARGLRFASGLAGHSSRVTATAVSADGRFAATGSADHTTILWRVSDRSQVRRLFGHRGPINACAFTASGRWIATVSGDRTARIWDPKTGEERHVLTGHGASVLDCAVSPGGTLLLTSSADGTVLVWETTTFTPLVQLVGHLGPVTGCDISVDGRWALTCSADSTIRIWDVFTGECVSGLRVEQPLSACCWLDTEPYPQLCAVGGADLYVCRFRPAA